MLLHVWAVYLVYTISPIYEYCTYRNGGRRFPRGVRELDHSFLSPATTDRMPSSLSSSRTSSAYDPGVQPKGVISRQRSRYKYLEGIQYRQGQQKNAPLAHMLTASRQHPFCSREPYERYHHRQNGFSIS